MHQLRTYIFAFATAISLLTSANVSAQQKKVYGASESDTIQLFRGVALSYDLAGTVMRMMGDYGQYEAAARFNLHDRYFPIIEAGWGTAKHNTDIITGIESKVEAPYGRIGCDFNVAKNKHDDYRVLIGARYGFTSFKTEATATVKDPIWGNEMPYEYNSGNTAYHWAELVFSVDAKICGPLHLGWSFRYKAKIHSGDTGNSEMWYIPGFGKNGNKLGGTFNITIELARKNKKA